MYKTAEELGIQPWEREGLEALLPVLENMPHATDYETAGFNMNTSGRTYTCGTIACIGGHLYIREHLQHLIEGRLTYEDVSDIACYVSHPNMDLYELFYPPTTFGAFEDEGAVDLDYDKITPQQARQAVINYLTDGKANWLSFLTAEEHALDRDED